MTTRRIILGLIVLTVVAFGVLAAAKLRATPKLDRVKVGVVKIGELLSNPNFELADVNQRAVAGVQFTFDCDEGRIEVEAPLDGGALSELLVTEKRITRRGPLERLAWLAGWR